MCKSSKTVYVGRIPFDYTEEQVGDIVRSVGPVEEIRLVFDKDTGKSKGFAFVEYRDKESAASAVRNLNNFQVGQQRLKVDYSNDSNSETTSQVAQLVADVLEEMKGDEKEQLVGDFKDLIRKDKVLAREVLQKNPQLALALVQASISLGKISQSQADSLLPEPSRKTKSNSRSRNTPQPVQQTVQQDLPVPSMETAANNAQSSSTLPDDQRQMLLQVMALSDDEIRAFPPDQRQAVLDIRGRVSRGEIVL